MPEKLDITALYAAALSPGSKQNLLAVYTDYISLVRNLEHVVRRYKPSNLSGYQLGRIYDKDIENNPWDVEELSPEGAAAYVDFVKNSKTDRAHHYCYVSVDHTVPEQNIAEPSIMSAPGDFAVFSRNNALPARIERWVAAYHQDETLKGAQFVVNGRWLMHYNHDAEGIKLSEAFADERIEKRFATMIDVLAQLSPDKRRFSEKEVMNAQEEALASALVAPFENVLLSSLSSLTEENHQMIKTLFYKRYGENYMVQAENQKLISSAASFQDYLNIRHLMHHQWDTLDGLGKFNAVETEKNASVRRRYLDSYMRLCGKPLLGRINAYIESAKEFAPVVAALNPDFLRRNDNESNSKFIERVKAYARSHPNANILVEANYPYGSDKKAPLLKSLNKLVPEAKIVDNAGLDIDGFMEKVSGYLSRSNYIDLFQQIEYKLSQHCLFCGKNYPPNIAWNYFRGKKIITPAEAERWAAFKHLRNALSHRYLDPRLTAEINAVFPEFLKMAIGLEDRIAALNPVIRQVEGSVYRVEHQNGMVVDIDFASKTILSVTDAKGASRPCARIPENAGRRQYAEEYKNGLSITVAGTEILSCRLQNGIVIELKGEKLAYPDGSKLYLDNPERNFLILKGGVKLITDKQFKVINYIINGKSVTLDKNEVLRPNSRRGLKIDQNGCLAKDELCFSGGRAENIVFKPGKNGVPSIQFADGTRLVMAQGAFRVSHNGVELSYRTRRAFAETYSGISPVKVKTSGSR